MKIIKAIKADHQALSKLMQESKAYWGFSPQQIEIWRDVLTIKPSYIDSHSVYKLEAENTILGFYSYIKADTNTVLLDNLFILPEYIGKGYGRLLMTDFMRRVKESYSRITLDSEPKAEVFYQKFGFKAIGKRPTSIEGRFLPIMEYFFEKNY